MLMPDLHGSASNSYAGYEPCKLLNVRAGKIIVNTEGHVSAHQSGWQNCIGLSSSQFHIFQVLADPGLLARLGLC